MRFNSAVEDRNYAADSVRAVRHHRTRTRTPWLSPALRDHLRGLVIWANYWPHSLVFHAAKIKSVPNLALNLKAVSLNSHFSFFIRIGSEINNYSRSSCCLINRFQGLIKEPPSYVPDDEKAFARECGGSTKPGQLTGDSFFTSWI